MKPFLVFLFAGLFFTITSCNNNNPFAGNNNKNKTKGVNQSIVGKWKIVDIEGEDITKEDRKDMLENASIEFTSDGRYYSVSSDEKESGDYTYDKRDRILATTSESGKKEELRISWMKDKLVIDYRNGEARATMRRVGNKNRDDADDEYADEDETDDYDHYESSTSITGKWRMTSTTNSLMEESEDNVEGKKIEFRRDGSYLATSDEGDDEHGTYSYDKKAKTLETISDSGDRENFDIEFRGKNRIILTYSHGKITLARN